MNLPERDTAYLKHILESIELIEEYMKSVSKEDFDNNQQLQDSVVRRFEIIGEACRLVSEDLKKQFPEILWREAIDMRNVLIHAYFGIDYQIIWNTIEIELPILKKQITMLITPD
ncbi:MAG: DUF86 domain-containing protein [Candidatus Cloacimonetes bacterium]|nr:DUF86 domain-containing protein [Candidatus Cloacimonadota bacterium]